MTAQELASTRAREMYARDIASQALGIEVCDVSPGHATALLTVTEAMLNGHGICHGGYIFTLADTAFAFACNTYSDVVVAARCDIAFLRPVRAGEQLTAVASERSRVGRSGVYDVTVRTGADVVAEFRGSSRALPPQG